MPSIAQLRANQLNARKSTGPKSPAGKARCSQNATKHGLTAETTVLLHESAAEFEDLKALLIEEFNPPTRFATIQVEHLAHQWWKVLRASRSETGMLNKMLISMADAEGIQHDQNINCDEGLGVLFVHCGKAIDLQRRYTTAVERAYYKALSIVERPDTPRRAKKRQQFEHEQYRSRQPKPQAAAAGASARFDALLAKAEAIVARTPAASSPGSSPETAPASTKVIPQANGTETPARQTNVSPSVHPANPMQPQQITRPTPIGSVSQFPAKRPSDGPAKTESGRDLNN